MNSLSTPAFAGIGAAALALACILSAAPFPLAAALAASAVATVLAFVAFAAQSRLLRDDERIVYRPVYVRRHDTRRRIATERE